jgi:hypothetical protein
MLQIFRCAVRYAFAEAPYSGGCGKLGAEKKYNYLPVRGEPFGVAQDRLVEP